MRQYSLQCLYIYLNYFSVLVLFLFQIAETFFLHILVVENLLIYLFFNLFFYLSIYLSVFLLFRLQRRCLQIRRTESFNSSIFISIYNLYLPIYPAIYLSIYLFTFQIAEKMSPDQAERIFAACDQVRLIAGSWSRAASCSMAESLNGRHLFNGWQLFNSFVYVFNSKIYY